MFLQSPLCFALVVIDFTLKWIFSSMYHSMGYELTWVFESLSTIFTYDFLHLLTGLLVSMMIENMFLQGTLAPKVLAAFAASKRLFSSMYSHVKC